MALLTALPTNNQALYLKKRGNVVYIDALGKSHKAQIVSAQSTTSVTIRMRHNLKVQTVSGISLATNFQQTNVVQVFPV